MLKEKGAYRTRKKKRGKETRQNHVCKKQRHILRLQKIFRQEKSGNAISVHIVLSMRLNHATKNTEEVKSWPVRFRCELKKPERRQEGGDGYLSCVSETNSKLGMTRRILVFT